MQTELENQIMFDQGISLKGKSIMEQHMNLDLKKAYETAIKLAHAHTDITIDLLKGLSALVMKNTGQAYKTPLGDFSSAQGDLRLLNVTAGVGGKSYVNYSKVPSKLSEFCTWLNKERNDCTSKNITQLYELTFDAHYHLATIHPWADGNGRMVRLVMNMLQFEFNLIPTKILKEDKEEYIKALVETRENDDLSIFREFMTATMVNNLTHDIDAYRKSIDDAPGSGEKIIALLSQDNTLSATALAERIGITPKAVEKHIAKMKAEGILKRIGPDKGGYWQVVAPVFRRKK
ncbi:MAG: Fic family protein [Odoribacter sp.]|nr:Fic family protein [Odoribacter sp.]